MWVCSFLSWNIFNNLVVESFRTHGQIDSVCIFPFAVSIGSLQRFDRIEQKIDLFGHAYDMNFDFWPISLVWGFLPFLATLANLSIFATLAFLAYPNQLHLWVWKPIQAHSHCVLLPVIRNLVIKSLNIAWVFEPIVLKVLILWINLPIIHWNKAMFTHEAHLKPHLGTLYSKIE